ncbi:stage VI sporulation protein D [Virgibacillus salexigens]|uniref:Stage VI sporulation protein D n=1 Tax=Virgibacillus kapii TaxID=1638645 RepID=A0ABQ2D8Z7_9BACI|nr:stage VI sporulation protein D [Virgibacillus kapii]GGJ49439.1 stage VI sporulation protein D [Virgibacillus kapii]
MSKDRPVFSFELNETLYFEKGQEVQEMRGVSLEPDISIHSFNDYISIRGIIELKGEYEQTEEITGESLEAENLQSKRYVERVEENGDGLATFSHQFPVEISVPANRVTDLNDVSVYIQTFDYEIPNPSLFRLYSTIEIHGVNENEVAEREEVDLNTPEDSFSSNLGEEEESFQFELKEPEVDTVNSEDIMPSDLPVLSSETEERDNTEALEPNDIEEPIVEESIEESSESHYDEADGRWKYKESKTLKEFFGTASKDEAESPTEYGDVNIDELSDDEWEEESTTSAPEVYEGSDDRTDDEETVKDVSYLSDMFRGNEESNYTKMRLCIVQEKDTIDSIAERYQISALQLIKQNQLDEDYDVSEGQLLYIPHKKK